MFRHLLKKNAIIPIILFFLFPLQIWGIDGTGMTFQIGVEKTLYKNFKIVNNSNSIVFIYIRLEN